MAITYKKQPWLVGSTGNVPPSDRTVKMAASQTGITGSPVYVSTSGTCKTESSATGTDDVVHGFLNEDHSTADAVNTERRITTVTSDQEWYIYLSNNGNDVTASQSYVGNQYGYAVDSSTVGYMTLDINNGNGTMLVVDLAANRDPSTYSTSDTQGLVIAKFLDAVVEGTKA